MKHSYFLIQIICVLLGSKSLIARGQNYIEYHKLCDEAAKQIEMGMLLPAQGMLMHAFSLVPEPKAIDLFHMAKCWSQNDNADSTKYYLDKALSMDPRIGRLTRIHNLWFEPVFGISDWEKINASTKTFEKPKTTPEEEKILTELIAIDSTIMKHRRIYSNVYKEIKNDSIETQKLWRNIDIDDSLAGIQFDAFLAENSDLNFEHIDLKHKLYETFNRLPVSYYNTHEEWFFTQLKLGIIDPNYYIDVFHAKQWSVGIRTNKPTTSIEHFFFDDEMSEEEQEFANKYGCYPDHKINKLRYEYDWPY
jgi:hypothetical protein